MSPHDSGVTELLRRASDDLVPDVDRLVRGGITRGRSRQRRARIGTTVASLAVIGVVGALAAVVPQDDPDSAPDRSVATEPTATETPTRRRPRRRPRCPRRGRRRACRSRWPCRLPRSRPRWSGSSGSREGSRQPSVQTDERDDKFVQLLVDGMALDVGFQLAADVTRARCEADATRLGGTCEAVDNGGWLVTWGPTLADGVTCTGVNLARYGFEVWATSCNAAVGKESATLAPAPPLDAAQLRALVSTNVWFE